MSGNLTTGALIACVILTTRLLGPVQQALLVAVRVPEILGVFRQIDAMMRLNSQSDNAAIAAPTASTSARAGRPCASMVLSCAIRAALHQHSRG